jgi:diadenosine tetraphosphate (Ap4A) HIT family hydrolase
MHMKDDLHAGGQALNATLCKFGAPQSRIQGYEYWSVLLRSPQLTLGSLILAAHGPATAWGALDARSFTELHRVVRELEATLREAFHCDKLNYLMLMMVDPHVHFHVIPRYAGPREFGGQVFTDAGWPGPPDLGRANETSGAVREQIRAALQGAWARQ